MNQLRNLSVRAKSIISFALVAVLTALIAYIGPQFAYERITAEAIPTLEIIGNLGVLARTIQAEALGFLSAGDDDAIQEIDQARVQLTFLAEQLARDLPADPQTEELLSDLIALTEQLESVSNALVVSHNQTVKQLNAFEAIDDELQTVLNKANAIIEQETAWSLAAGNIDRISSTTIFSQQLNRLVRQIQIMQKEAVEFSRSGDQDAVEEFEEAQTRAAETREFLTETRRMGELSQNQLIQQLAQFENDTVTTGQAIINSHQQTLTLLANLEDIEEELNEALAAVQEVSAVEVEAGIARANWRLIGFSTVILGLSVGLGLLFTRNVVGPLNLLSETATQFGAGDLTVRANVETDDEIGRLAGNFNQMADRLQQTISQIEKQANQRVQELQTVAGVSRAVSAILDRDDLLSEVVKLVKEQFNYYYAHIYLLDDARENLVVAQGYGEAGRAMMANKHSIAFNARTSLVAQAARTGQIVRVDNVRQAEDWLPNPLLPNTYSEMAVPIMVEGQIAGVLDVQQNKIAGMDEADENLLRILADQVSIAIRNARLFAEIEQAFADAREAQQRYVQQAWRTLQKERQFKHTYQPDGITPPPAEVRAKLKQQVLGRQHPVPLPLDGDHNNETPPTTGRQALVAPVMLGGQPIGTLQLHRSQAQPVDDNNDQIWDDEDMALVEAVLNRVAQTAENLRLFEETRERAAREATIREITNKLRAAPNVEQLITIATEEIAQRLSATHAKLELGMEHPANGNGQTGY